MSLKINKEWFIDEKGRSVLLRGVNLGGSSKVPFTPNGATHLKTDFSDHRNVSFIGRPFPVKEANVHFERLKHWGFNCLRFLITWEAVEHKGPKGYDKEYLDYIEEIIKIASEYGFYTFIDPHQDVWSRMSGGDGAPGWTFERIGLDFTKFDASEAALLMQYRYNPEDPNAYPPMHWISNSVRFANGTMWTLFFGGKDFAPTCLIEGENAQDYLQNHYINAIKQVLLRIRDIPKVLGFDTLNEPEQGFIEKKVDGTGTEKLSEELGYSFTPFDAMVTGSGYPRIVGFKEIKRFGIKETRRDELNIGRISCWLDNSKDIWRNEGVWGLDKNGEPIILNNDFFTTRNGKKIEFYKDYLTPFINKYTKVIREIMPYAMIFFEGPATRLLKEENPLFDVPKNVVHAGHWYDDPTLGTKKPMIKASYDTVDDKIIMGKKNVQDMFIRQLNKIKIISSSIHSGIPTLIGEFGLPFDLNNKEAYKNYHHERDVVWEKHIKLLSMYYNALDANLLHSTQWNYTADNTNEWGDQWNLEDLSIFSKDQIIDLNDINSGGRAIHGFCRPHFIRCSGTPLKMDFNRKNGVFHFEFDADTSIKASTLIYIPKIQYPNGFRVKVSEGNFRKDEDKQLLCIDVQKDGIHTIEILRIN